MGTDTARFRALLAAVAVLWMVGCGRLGLASGEDEIMRGQRLFSQHGCNGCHTVGPVGTPIGPDLAGIGARHSKAWFERWLRDPESVSPTAHMPRLDLPSADVPPLAAYLTSLR